MLVAHRWIVHGHVAPGQVTVAREVNAFCNGVAVQVRSRWGTSQFRFAIHWIWIIKTPITRSTRISTCMLALAKTFERLQLHSEVQDACIHIACHVHICHNHTKMQGTFAPLVYNVYRHKRAHRWCPEG